MNTGITPDAGSAVTAAAQITYQRDVIITGRVPPGLPVTSDSCIFAGQSPLDFPRQNGTNIRDVLFVATRGLPRIRVSLFLYPTYNRGDFNFIARNYLSWRLVGNSAPGAGPRVLGLIDPEYTPLTTPQLLPVGQPISFSILAGGYEGITIEFDTTSGAPNANQGQDLCLVTISASQ